MRRVLLVSWSLPPEPTGSAVIVGNLAKQFRADEMVLAGEKPCGRPPVTWKRHWPRLKHIAVGLPPNWRGARWWRRVQLPLMLLRSILLVKKLRCAAVLVVFPNEEFLLVGYLTALWTGIPLFVYFHNTYLENRRGIGLHFARWLQGGVFSLARHVFVMSDGMVDLYKHNYPKLKCSALVHSFNESLASVRSFPGMHNPARLIISGNINESCRDAAIRFSEAVAQMKNVTLTILSGTPRSDLVELGVLRNGTYYETVSRDDLLSRLAQADIVLLPHGFTGGCAPEEYQSMFPTKTIEYLISGRPILAHTPPDCYLTRFLKENGCAYVVEEASVTALIDALEQLRTDRDLCARLVERALHAARKFHAPQVATFFRTQLEQYGGNHP
jgi:glycosyltransferase involved in cell wall biosynthesis